MSKGGEGEKTKGEDRKGGLTKLRKESLISERLRDEGGG